MSNRTVTDLLKLIGKDSSESEPFDSPLGEFIHKFSVESNSEERVENSILWYTYKSVYEGELSKIVFFRELSKIFERARTGKKRYYRISGNFDISREGLLRSEYFNKG